MATLTPTGSVFAHRKLFLTFFFLIGFVWEYEGEGLEKGYYMRVSFDVFRKFFFQKNVFHLFRSIEPFFPLFPLQVFLSLPIVFLGNLYKRLVQYIYIDASSFGEKRVFF